MNALPAVSRLLFWTAAISVLSGCPTTTAPEEPVPGCTDTRAANYAPAATEDDGSCVPVESSQAFLDLAISSEHLEGFPVERNRDGHGRAKTAETFQATMDEMGGPPAAVLLRTWRWQLGRVCFRQITLVSGV